MELFEAAKKAADMAAEATVSSSGPEVSRCIDALKLLKGFPVTSDILIATQLLFAHSRSCVTVYIQERVCCGRQVCQKSASSVCESIILLLLCRGGGMK